MKNHKEKMPVVEVENAVRHSKNNIVRSVVLLKRAVNNLTFADRSLEGTDNLVMTQDIGTAKRSIADVLRVLDNYL